MLLIQKRTITIQKNKIYERKGIYVEGVYPFLLPMHSVGAKNDKNKGE